MTQVSDGRVKIGADQVNEKAALETAHMHLRAAGEVLQLAAGRLNEADQGLAKDLAKQMKKLAKVERKTSKKLRKLDDRLYRRAG